jgi:hypothetical protein
MSMLFKKINGGGSTLLLDAHALQENKWVGSALLEPMLFKKINGWGAHYLMPMLFKIYVRFIL